MPDDDYQRHVLSLVERKRPRSILAIGPRGRELFGTYLRTRGDKATLTCLEGERAMGQLAGFGRCQFGFVERTLEHLSKDEGLALLARLRDIHTERFCALVPVGPGGARHASAWDHTDLVAHGMTLLGRYQKAGDPLSLYGFDIASYKRTPDWLNPRHWAHPELWDKYRW